MNLTHGKSPSGVCNSTPQPLKCTCSESANSFAEICPLCVAAYDQWLIENQAEAREETIRLSPAQLFAALEMFDAETQPEFVLTVRVERAA